MRSSLLGFTSLATSLGILFSSFAAGCTDANSSPIDAPLGKSGPEGWFGWAGPGVGAPQPGTYLGPHKFVDPGCDWYFSTDGDDVADGSSPETPWADPVRKTREICTNAQRAQKSPHICFRRGDVFRLGDEPAQARAEGPARHLGRSPFVVLGRCGGTPDAPTLLEPYGYLDQPRPRLQGSRLLPAAFTPSEQHPSIQAIDLGGVLRTDEPLELRGEVRHYREIVDQLFVNGERLLYARYPNFREGETEIGFEPAREWTAGRSMQLADAVRGDGSVLYDPALPGLSKSHGHIDWRGAFFHHKPITWIMGVANVVSWDAASHELGVDSPVAEPENDDGKKGYFLNRHLAALDSAGEWFYDASAERLYVWPPEGVELNGAEVEASIALVDLEVTPAPAAAPHAELMAGYYPMVGINLPGTAHAVVRELDLRYFSGIGIDAKSQTVVQDCAFYGIGDTVIDIMSFGDDVIDEPMGVRIERNWVEDIGANGFLINATEAVIQNNTLLNVGTMEQLGMRGLGPHLGLTVHENGFGIKMGGARAMTARSNYLERIGHNGVGFHGRDQVVENNVVFSACAAKGDCGAIKSWAWDADVSNQENFARADVTGALVQKNIVLNTIGAAEGVTFPGPPLGNGMFIDFGTQQSEFVDNIAANSTSRGLSFKINRNETIRGNLLYNNALENYAHLHMSDCGMDTCPFVLKNNTFFSEHADQAPILLGRPPSDLTAERNTYFNPYSIHSAPHEFNEWSRHSCTIKLKEPGEEDATCYALQAWQSAFGLDRDSRSADFLWLDRYPSDIVSDNLVPNATFDTGVEDWKCVNGCSFTWGEHPELGAAGHWEHGTRGGVETLRIHVPVEAGKEYEMRLDTVGDGSGDMPHIALRDVDGRFPVLPYVQQSAAYRIMPEANAEAQLNFSSEAESVWIDNVRFRQVQTYAVPKGVTLRPHELPPAWTRSMLYVNSSHEAQQVDLEGRLFYDLEGNRVDAPFRLEPFQGRVLIAGRKIGLGKAARDFGAVQQGQPARQRPVVSSIGSLPLTIESLTVEGPAAQDFGLAHDGCTGQTLNPSAICELTLDFTPSASGTREATLVIATNDDNTPTARVALKGEGQ